MTLFSFLPFSLIVTLFLKENKKDIFMSKRINSISIITTNNRTILDLFSQTSLNSVSIKIQTQITILKLIKLEQKKEEKKKQSQPIWASVGRRICGGGRRTNGRSLCVRESSSQSAAREEKKKIMLESELQPKCC